MTYDKHECDQMCERLAAYLEGDLAPAEQSVAERHLASCEACATVLAELRSIAADAAQLPPLSPSHDLWAGIESRIRTQVTTIGTAGTPAPRARRLPWQLAIAASALVALTAGTTYVMTRAGSTATPVPTVAQRTPPSQQTAIAAPPPATREQPSPAPVPPSNMTNVLRTKKNVNVARVYDHEISLLDSLVRNRRTALDPKTVAVIEKNLRIIDSAIAESRRALAKDPNSPLLTNRLNNVLGSKVELLQTIAFLPSQS